MPRTPRSIHPSTRLAALALALAPVVPAVPALGAPASLDAASLDAASLDAASLDAASLDATPPAPSPAAALPGPARSFEDAAAVARAEVARLAQTSPALRALYRPGQPGPSLITGLAVPTPAGDAGTRARAFVVTHAALLGVDAGALGAPQVQGFKGRSVVTFPQAHAGVPVWGRTVVVTLDDAGVVRTLANDLAPVLELARATRSLEDARRAAAAAVGAAEASAGERVIVVGLAGAFEAAVFFATPAGTLEAREIVVNLHDGQVASVRSAVRH